MLRYSKQARSIVFKSVWLRVKLNQKNLYKPKKQKNKTKQCYFQNPSPWGGGCEVNI